VGAFQNGSSQLENGVVSNILHKVAQFIAVENNTQLGEKIKENDRYPNVCSWPKGDMTKDAPKRTLGIRKK